jgi:RNA polymerase sigma-70 factor (ECF subfamily)
MPQFTEALAADDAMLLERIAQREHGAFESLMRLHNGRLFRVARAIVKNDAEAEDVLQEAYLDAYRHLAEFRGNSRLGTWLVRIVVNRALMHRRKHRRDRTVISISNRSRGSGSEAGMDLPDQVSESPNAATLRAELRRILERRIDELPVAFRTVFVLREVEDLSVEETAGCLGIPPATVRTRLFRARTLLRESLARDIDMATGDVFAFAGDRCDRIVAAVLDRLGDDADTGTPAPPPASNAT